MCCKNSILILLSFALMPAKGQEPKIVDRPDWSPHFEKAQVTGTIAILDEREKAPLIQVHNPNRARKRFCPASTFKIPHALFALDAGVVKDEFQVFPWDGTKRFSPAWNRDQTLRSSMRHSTVWVYERFLNEIGVGREGEYLTQAQYGNQKATGKQPFWLYGDLEISAIEQIGFLQKLYRNELSFPIEHQRLVKDLIITEAGKDWILRAKTGWTGQLGWWVGWVETAKGAVFFALNIDTPNGNADLAKRQEIPRAILKSLEVLP